MLAERWELRKNRTRCLLRRGVTFQDGQPFNAQAVGPASSTGLIGIDRPSPV